MQGPGISSRGIPVRGGRQLVVPGHQGGERREERGGAVAQVPRPDIPVPGRACTRVAEPACCNYYLGTQPLAPVLQLHFVALAYAADLRLALYFHAHTVAGVHQRVHHVRSMVRCRVGAVSPLHHAAHTVSLEKAYQRLGVEVVERRLDKVRARAHVGIEVIPGLEVGEIAPALARDHNLPRRTRHLLQKGDARIRTGRNQF